MLDWSPRLTAAAIVGNAESLISLGLMKQHRTF
jgi:hypothetical protein